MRAASLWMAAALFGCGGALAQTPLTQPELGAPVWAEPTEPSVAELTQMRQALLALKPQSGDFVQRAPDGTLIEGQFHLSLPDKMRFAYTGPQATVVTVAGKWLSVQEAPGLEANRYPVSATPLKLLRESWDRPIDPAHVRSLIHTGRLIELTLVDGSGDAAGELKLIFDYPQMSLRGWQTLDVQGLRTQVALRNVTYFDALPNSVFFVDENEDSE
jgi:outer membrane lipoprotein-sorting protein